MRNRIGRKHARLQANIDQDVVAVKHEPYTFTGGTSERWYQARCSCGEYSSKRYFYPGQAEQAGAHHKRDKG